MVGCTPAIRGLTPGGACNETLSLLQDFSSANPGTNFSLGNSCLMTKGVIDNPIASDFEEVEAACCGMGPFKGSDKCTPKYHLCKKRDEYLFWDWFHPTEKASEMAALSLLYSTGQGCSMHIDYSLFTDLLVVLC